MVVFDIVGSLRLSLKSIVVAVVLRAVGAFHSLCRGDIPYV